ncbi:substrate-binding periplasmic protein [Silvanigrella aquatica]|uniref:Solute-binding protein family 3/N-terminal domain-containing protein n=1 Tax=Silvanigrella aquatica TaxID=1915309 RepID=A0A1L4CZ93_9BACT|nr:transporter substrate-binding domain-containing protein [Silvanigrella aquatica]APJ03255.1 hypothetical protein AXG55_04795 [Silvanigrella aquatica]
MKVPHNKSFCLTIILFLCTQSISFAAEKKFKIIVEETPIHSFLEIPGSNPAPKSKSESKAPVPKIVYKPGEEPKPVLVGSDIEIVTKIFDKLKIPVEIELVHWTRLLPMMINGEADMALGIQKNSKFDKFVNFTRLPVRSKNYSFYGLTKQVGESQVMSFEDALAHHYRVGIIVGFTYPKIFWDYYPFENRVLNSHLVESYTFRDNIIKLKEKKIDLFIADRERVNVILKKIGADETIFQYKNVLYWKDYFFAFSKKTKEPKIKLIRAFMDREIYKMTESDEIPEINLEWIKKGT